MITVTLPLLPTVVAIAFLIGFTFAVAEEGGGLAMGFIPFIAFVFSFFLMHGVVSMFGGY